MLFAHTKERIVKMWNLNLFCKEHLNENKTKK